MKATSRLAEFASSVDYQKLPSEVIDMAKLSLMDALGCGIFGSTMKWSRILQEFVLERGGKPEASIWAKRTKAPLPEAALANGTMVHSFELDDVFHRAKIHPGAPTIPAAVAMAEKQGSSGKELIEAVVGGYEVMIRLGLALGPNEARNRGWHITGVCGPLGAAVATARLLGLDAEKMANALGLAGTQSSGLFAFTADGSDSKRLHPGRAAQSGIIAALLADKGFRGPTKVLEAEDGGLLRAFSGESSFEPLINGLGERWEVLDNGFKLYSCCGSLHSMIDALLELKREHGIGYEEVERVEVETSKGVLVQCGWKYEPLSLLQAQMSLKYCASVALMDGKVFIDQFTEERIRDPEILKMTKKVTAYVEQGVDKIYPRKFAARVRLYLKDGRELESYVEEPKGLSRNRPASRKELEEKFLALSSKVIGEGMSREILNKLRRLENLDDVNSLFELI